MMITEKQQLLLVEMYKNKEQITRSGQSIYTSHSFYDRMGDLKRMGFVKSKNYSNGNGKGFKPNIYYLTNRGIALIKILVGENWL